MTETKLPHSRSRFRRTRIVIVLLTVWAVASTGIAAWNLLQPTRPSQAQTWASDAATLYRLDRDFGFVALDTNQYLLTRNRNWTWNAANWIYLSYEAVLNAVASPGGFPSGPSLGFNVTGMCVAVWGYTYIDSEAVNSSNYPYIQQAAITQLQTYQNLSALLDGVQGGSTGTDPLSSIGPANVALIHALMLTLWTVNLNVGFGQGPIITERCGI